MRGGSSDVHGAEWATAMHAVRAGEMTVATSYTELMAGIQAQVGALGLKLTDFDDLAGFAPGLSGKVFGMLQVKRLGPEKMFDALRAAGLRLRIEVDPEQEAKMKQRIASNYNPRQANQARNGHAATPLSTAVLSRVFKPLGRKGGKKRWERVSKKERSTHAAMMANARWKKERKRRKAAHRRRQREQAAKVPASMTAKEYGEKLAKEALK